MNERLNYHQRQELAKVNTGGAPVHIAKRVASGHYVHVMRSDRRDVYLLPLTNSSAQFVRAM